MLNINSFNTGPLTRKKTTQTQKNKNNNVKSPRQLQKQISNHVTTSNRTTRVHIIENNQKYLILDKLSQKKLLVFVLKDIVYEKVMRMAFDKIQNCIYIKKIALDLLNNKKKKSLQDGFFKIKFIYLNKKQILYQTKLQDMKSSKLFNNLFSKILKRKVNQGFKLIKKKSRRKQNIFNFSSLLADNIYRYYQRQFYQTFISKLKVNSQYILYRALYIKKISILNDKRIHRLLTFSFNKIINYCIHSSYNSCVQQRRNKNKQIVSLNSSRKTVINQEKQKLKKLKYSFDSVNLQKNRSMNELKKSRTVIKQQMGVDIKSLLREQEQFLEELEETKSELNELKRLWGLRQNRIIKAQNGNYIDRVMKIVEKVESENQIMEKGFLNQELRTFQNQSPQYYFHNNIQLLDVVHTYEKVKKINSEDIDPEYTNKKQQNQTLKSTISLIAGRQIQKSIHGSIIKFNKDLSINQGDFSFSPLKSFAISEIQQKKSNKQSQKSEQQTNSQYFLPYSSKNSKKSSSNTQNRSIRTIGKITSKANYFNS